MEKKRVIKLGVMFLLLFLGIVTVSVSATIGQLIYSGEQDLEDIELIVDQLINDVNTLYDENGDLEDEVVRLNGELVSANEDIGNTIEEICIKVENLPPPFQANYDTYCD